MKFLFHSFLPKARYVIVAATRDERALWLEKGGIFTQELIQGLQGEADYDRNGIIQFLELANYVKIHVIYRANDQGISQLPQAQQFTKFDSLGNFMFFNTKGPFSPFIFRKIIGQQRFLVDLL